MASFLAGLIERVTHRRFAGLLLPISAAVQLSLC